MPYGITAPDIITWIIFILVQVVTTTRFMTKFGIKINDHEKLLYDAETGQVNMVSFDALDRNQANCQAAMNVQHGIIKDDIKDLEKDLELEKKENVRRDNCVAVLNFKLENPCG